MNLIVMNDTYLYNTSFLPNETNQVYWTKLLWQILVVTSATCLAITTYLLVGVVLFVKHEKFDKSRRGRASSRLNASITGPINGQPNENEMISRHRRTSNSPSHRRKLRPVYSMHFVLLLTLVVNFIRGIIEQLIFFYGGTSDQACDVLTKLMIGFTALAIHGCVVFLWLRQYVFYANPLLHKIRRKSLRVFSYFTYVEMVVTVLTCLVLHIWWRDYTSFDGLCRPALGTRKVSPYVPYLVLVVSTVSIQLSLTFLFVYPIFVHNRQMKRHKKRNPVQNKEDPNYVSKSTLRLLQCVKRALVGVTVSISTDIAGALVAIWLPEDMPLFVLSTLYELDIMLNVFCLIYTYVDWKEIVIPWKDYFQSRKEHKTNEVVPFHC